MSSLRAGSAGSNSSATKALRFALAASMSRSGVHVESGGGGNRSAMTKLRMAVSASLGADRHMAPGPLAHSHLDCNAWVDADRSRAWLVFTHQRSGSTWMVNTLEDRTGNLVVNGGEITKRDGGGIAACYPDGERSRGRHPSDRQARDPLAAEFDDSATTAACKCALVRRFQALMAGSKIHDGSFFGFKLMLPWDNIVSASNKSEAYGPLAQAVCELGIPFVFIWRRNVLRQLLSNQAMNIHRNISTHPRREDQLRQAGAPITLDTQDLRRKIEGVLNNHRNLEQAFTGRLHCPTAQRARRYHYEDIVDSAPHSSQLWGTILNTLGVWHESTMLRVHADKPVNSSLLNANGVFRALQGTSYAWMLTSDSPSEF